jgi:hypothetical protein
VEASCPDGVAFAARRPPIVFELRDLSDALARSFREDVLARNAKLESFLAASGFAEPFSGAISIDVSDYTPPVSQALLPAWHGRRGYIKFAALRIRQNRAAILHELVHVHAPNQVRFLAEGLAVHLEETIGNIDAYPTLGAPAETRIGRYGRSVRNAVQLEAFDQVSLGMGLSLGDSVALETAIPDRTERGAYAYLISGTFVKFLAAAYGLRKLKLLYDQTPLTPGECRPSDPQRYAAVFGKMLPALQSEWLEWLEASR